MMLIALLFFCALFVTLYIFKRNADLRQKMLNLRFMGIALSVSVAYFFLSYIIFGVMFGLGESGSANSPTPLNVILSIVSFGITPVVSLVEYADKIYYNNSGHGFPNFLYFPVSYIVNSLLFGIIIALFYQRSRRSKSG